MLQLEPIELILRTIPEGFLYMLGMYIFSYNKIEKKKYIISSLIIGISIYFFRELPISYGVHTILTILLTIFLSMYYNKIEVILCIKGTIITFIIQFISEGINVLVLKLIPGLDLNTLFSNPTSKNLMGLPSLFITVIILVTLDKLKKKKDKINE